MQNKQILLTVMLCLFFGLAKSQSPVTYQLEGVLQDDHGNAVQGVILLVQTGKGINTLENGSFRFPGLSAGKYTLEIRAMGFKKLIKQVQLPADNTPSLVIKLKKDDKGLSEVTVWGKTAVEAVRQQSYNVVAVDAKKLYNTTMDVGQVLNRVSGVRVRESGGVGADINFSLNGFTGQQVKFFVDGMPMDNFGTSFQLNNIPINFAERIEVYKGVVPVWLGGDALGGAVNIVTNTAPRTYLDVSYSYGSFNTHKTAINAGIISKSGLTLQVNAYQNYSDNNYKVNVDVADLETGVYTPMRVRRFHDTYHNEALVTNVGVVGKKYADQLLIGVMLGKNQADIQTGNRMYDVYGGRTRSGNIIQPTLKYTKTNLFVKGLDLRISGMYNPGEERAVDTLFRLYNWLGQWQYKDPNNPETPGGESSRMDYRYKNNNGIGNFNLSYQLNAHHSFVLSNVITSFNRTGINRFDPENEADKQPKKTFKNIAGLGYKYDYNERWSTSVFVKNYHQSSKTSILAEGEYYHKNGSINQWGYGLASTYFVLPTLQAKVSYEKAYRLPNNDELFGDVLNLTGNPDLRPESSDNINIGLNYSFTLKKDHHFVLDGNFIFRNAKDYIRNQLQGVSFTGRMLMVPVNTRDVTNRGVDADVRYTFRDFFTAGVNITYQNLRNNTRIEPGTTVQSPVYRDRIPNMPYLFGNANVSFTMRNVGWKDTRLTIGYNMLFAEKSYLRWPSQGSADTKYLVPRQFCHDMNAVYSLKNGKYNVSAGVSNLFDKALYDNFSLQKPGRAFNVKVRYFFVRNKTH